MYNGAPFEVSIRPRTYSSSEDEPRTQDSVIEMHELKHRGPREFSGPREFCDNGEAAVEIYEREIREGDTLQSISLRHHITVAELKRVNNLLTDQDFHALRSIKLPLKKHGILAEQLEAGTSQEPQRTAKPAPVKSWDTSPDGSLYGDLNENYEADSDDSSESRGLLVRTLSIRDSYRGGRQSKDAKKFLEKMDGDLEKIRDSTTSYKNSLEEVTASLTCKRITPLSPVQKASAWNGADCGIRWWSALLCVIIVGLLVPSLYFLRYKYTGS